MEFLTVGLITKTVGLKGELKVNPSTHFCDSRFKVKSHLFVYNQKTKSREELIIKSSRSNKGQYFLSFKNINYIDQAENLVGHLLQVEKDLNFLEEDSYFFCDLLGLDVYFDNSTYIGKVKKVEEFTSYQTLRVSKENSKDCLIPFLNQFIINVDIDNKKIIVKYIEGLLQ